MKTKMTITMIIICFGLLESASALTYFDDGQVHNVDWVIEDNVHVGSHPQGPVPWPGITTFNLINGGFIAGPVGDTRNITVTWDGIVNIEGGIVLGDLRIFDNGEGTIAGGIIFDDVFAMNNASVDISGGWIGDKIRADKQSTITIAGRDFAVDGVPIDYYSYPRLTSWSSFSGDTYYGVLTGTLANGDPINNSYYIAADSDIILVEPIPEPATILLLGFGVLLLFCKNKN